MAGRGFLAKIGKASIARAAEEEGPAVLQVRPAMEAGGIERSAVDFAQAVTRARGRALVVSEGGQMERHLQRAGARHISMPLATRNPDQNNNSLSGKYQESQGQVMDELGHGICEVHAICPKACTLHLGL